MEKQSLWTGDLLPTLDKIKFSEVDKMYSIQCSNCKKEINKNIVQGVCPYCDNFIKFEYTSWSVQNNDNSMWRYKSHLPIINSNNIISMGEGTTPLLSSRLSKKHHIFIKDESRNPTGSMKDRAMSVSYSKGKELGINTSIMFSAGGAGIASGAYAGKSNIENIILIPKGVSKARKTSMQIYGSQLIEVQGNIEDCL